MKNFKLGFGPMSSEIIELLCEYGKPIMIIASRNQIDADSGYVMTTFQLADKLRSLDTRNILVCRDHCGPYFQDSEKNLSLRQAIEATKRTILCDIENGFDLIHIDTSRCDDQFAVAQQLIEYCLYLNPEIRFEFGTEENIGVAASVDKYRADVAFAKQFPNMDFVVAQTGSLVWEDRQAGELEPVTVPQLVDLAEQNNVRLKEHNADYLTTQMIQHRRVLGIHSMNIAPQLGVVQTKLLRSLSQDFAEREWQDFCSLVLSSGKYKKWTGSDYKSLMVDVAGHYCFNSDQYQSLKQKISSRFDFQAELRREIFGVLDAYYQNFC